jgi:hypothetical protein
MMMAPMNLVDRPQEVVQQYWRAPFLSKYLISKALEKF